MRVMVLERFDRAPTSVRSGSQKGMRSADGNALRALVPFPHLPGVEGLDQMIVLVNIVTKRLEVIAGAV